MSLPRIGVAMAAIIALALSLFSLAQPVRADHVDGNTVRLHQDLGGGVSSESPGEFEGECDGVNEGEVLFHFVANQLADGTTDATLTASFEGMGDVTVDGYFPGNGHATLHFDVVLGASATLTDAYATFNVDQTERTKLVLSHICDLTGDEESESPSESASESVMPSESASESVMPSESASESVMPSESASESVMPSESASESVMPSESASESVAPSESASESVAPSEEMVGDVEIEKFFCPTEGETRTEIDVFGPVAPTAQLRQQGEPSGCEVGADVEFTIWQGGVELTSVWTDEDGIVEFELEAGDYVVREEMSEATADFSVGAGEFTAIVVVNYEAEAQGQVKVLKYACDADENSVEFYLEGNAPNLEMCDPGDAEFMLDDGPTFATEGGIAVVWADEGTHTLTEVSTEASIELEVVADEVTTVIVLNNVAARGAVQVMKHVCPDSVQSEADFDALDTFAGDPAGSFLDKVLACPVITMPGDVGPEGALDADDAFFDQFVANGEATFDFTVAGAGGMQTLADDGTFVPAEVCESNLGLELDGDATTDVCVEVSRYQVDGVAEGSVTVTESAPDGFRFGSIEFTPNSGDADTLVSAADGTIVLNTTGDDDETLDAGEGAEFGPDNVMVHVYNFANVEDDVAGESQAPASESPESDVQGGQGGPGQGGTGSGIPDTAADGTGSRLPAILLGLTALAALGGMGALNLQAVRRRVD